MPERGTDLPPEGGRNDAADRQPRDAAELSDRAAESVSQRYDATKEVHLDPGEPEEPEEEPKGPEQ